MNSLLLQPVQSGTSNGENGWSTTTHAGTLISDNPATGEQIASVYCSSFDDYERVITGASAAFQTWQQVPAPKRGDIIRLLGDELRKNKTSLAELVSLEMGKSKQEGLGEVQEMIDMADFAVGQSRMLYGRTMHSERIDHRMYEQWHSLGVVGVITAFNFPVAVWAWNAFIAAIAGNTVVWKPSPKTPLCAIAIQHICNSLLIKLNLPAVFSLFTTADNSLVEKFAADTRVALISFTGSTTVGKHINEIVAHRLGKTILELSGNNAVIVDETADLKLAIPAIIFGAIGTAGQRCTTTRRLFLHASIYDTVISILQKNYQKITVGNPLNENNLMGPLIDAHAVNIFLNTINEVKKMGGAILFGGKKLERPGFFVEPTLVEAQNHWDIVQRETFGPILYIIKFDHFAEAIQLQNQSNFGLSSALFTNDLKNAELFLSTRGSDCGIANINLGTSGAEIGGAFGGEKNTGGGREAGSDAWKAYMRRQTNTINWSSALQLAQGIKFDIHL